MRVKDIAYERASIQRLYRRLSELDAYIESVKIVISRLTNKKNMQDEYDKEVEASNRKNSAARIERDSKIESIKKNPICRTLGFINKRGREAIEKEYKFYDNLVYIRENMVKIRDHYVRQRPPQFYLSDKILLEKKMNELPKLLEMKDKCSRELKLKLSAYKDYQEKLENIKARAAANEQQTRNIGSSLIKRLVKTHKCPYCFQSLGDNPHVDHIHPVSKGGQSRAKNMAWVCSRCNLLKKDMTLREFIIKCGLNRQEIEERLALLKKEF